MRRMAQGKNETRHGAPEKGRLGECSGDDHGVRVDTECAALSEKAAVIVMAMRSVKWLPKAALSRRLASGPGD